MAGTQLLSKKHMLWIFSEKSWLNSQVASSTDSSPSPGEHLGLFWRKKKHQVFSPAAADET
jgi:hypothetical protein